MKQLGLGFAQYIQDYDEKYPCGLNSSWVTGSGWGGQIFAYVKSSQVYTCPSDTVTALAGKTTISYGYNMAIPTVGAPFGGIKCVAASMNATAKTVLLCEVADTYGNVTVPDESGGSPYDYTSVGTSGLPGTSSSRAVMFGGTADNAYQGWYATGYLSGRTYSQIVPGGTTSPQQNYVGQPTAEQGRHLEGSNFLMTDGHVKWYKGAAVSAGLMAVNSTDAQEACSAGGAICAAEGTEYAGADKHAVTFSPR
jgi:prepilin-type processing-associated H-X9-DG protein